MSTRVLLVLALALWGITVVIGGYYFVRGQTTPSSDGRLEILLPTAGRDLVLAEMRAMLKSVQGVVAGVAERDMTKVAAAARASGAAAAVDMSPQLMAALPLQFKQLGMSVHQGFDEIAAAAGQSVPPSEVLSRLDRQLSACVACHASYRLAPGDARQIGSGTP